MMAQKMILGINGKIIFSVFSTLSFLFAFTNFVYLNLLGFFFLGFFFFFVSIHIRSAEREKKGLDPTRTQFRSHCTPGNLSCSGVSNTGTLENWRTLTV